ncbi:MAG: hypothetical protein NVS3B7_10580 [Candidatus Elarobacter sp.]
MRARAAFCLAVASTAAAVASPCVEALSNGGAFGPGTWTDRSNADVVPVLGLGLVFAGAFVFVLAQRAAAPAHAAPLWMHDALVPVARAARAANAVLMFALQIALLFGMETVEQTAVWGHPLGGTIWLGGPLAASLAVHAAAAVLVAVVFERVLRWLAGRVAGALRCALRVVLERPPLVCVAPHPALGRLAARALRRLKGRAPPLQLRPI